MLIQLQVVFDVNKRPIDHSKWIKLAIKLDSHCNYRIVKLISCKVKLATLVEGDLKAPFSRNTYYTGV